MNTRLPQTMYALMDELDQRQDAREAAKDVSAARPVIAAMHAIKQHQITPEVVAHLMSGLSELISRAGWSHTAEAEMARNTLDDLSDDLTGDAL